MSGAPPPSFVRRALAAIAGLDAIAWTAVAVVIAGAALRIAVNDVTRYSPADEAHYVASARALAQGGLSRYPELVREHLTDQRMWPYPTPIRWGYLGLGALACAARGSCDPRALAWLSTLAGVVVIAFTYLLGARLVGRRAALLGAALTVTSPIQLAMGRRALGDEVHCATSIIALWALVRLVQDEGRGGRRADVGRGTLFVLSAALAFAVKETFAFYFAALAVIYVLAPRERGSRLSDALVILAPPSLFFAGFALLAGEARGFFDLLAVGQASFLGEYTAQSQSGPPHRPLFDLFLLAPIVCVIAASALGRIVSSARADAGGERHLALFAFIGLVAFMGLPKNVRFVIVLDPLLRLLAAWTLLTHHVDARRARPLWAAALAIGVGGQELSLFRATFLAATTYDPTTHELLKALHAVPRPNAQAEPSAWPVIFFTAAALAVIALLLARRRVMIWRKRDHDAPPETEAPYTELPPTTKASRMGRYVTAGLAVGCILVALLVGRSCVVPDGPQGHAPGGPGAPVSAEPAPSADPAADEVSAGLAAKDPEEAARHFRRALELRPGHYGATFQLARALDRAGHRSEAREQWQRVLTMAEVAGDAQLAASARDRLAQVDGGRDPMALGLDALFTARDPVLAAARFREVLAQNPEHYGATYHLAVALDQARDTQASRALWEKMLRMAEAIGDSKTAETARARLKELGQAAPADQDDEEMRLGVQALYDKRDPRDAAAHFKKILARSPEHYGATYQLAVALDQPARSAEARPYWEKMLKLAEAAKDTKIADAARARLAQKP